MAETVILFLALYGAVGVLVAIIFSFFFANRLDDAAKGSTLAFRLIILPGALILWPYMVGRILSNRRINQPTHQEGEA